MSSKEIQSPDQLHLPLLHGVTDKPFVKGTVHYNPTPQKATNEQLIESYSRLHNVWSVAKEFGMCGQTVHQRLTRIGVIVPINIMTEREIQRIRDVYESGIMHGDGKLKKLSKELNRTVPFISRFARRMGLTTYSRDHTDESKRKSSKSAKRWIKKKGHPRGFLNHTHNVNARENIGRAAVLKWMGITRKEHLTRIMKTRETTMKRYSVQHNAGDKKKTWKAQWAQVGPHYHYFRSSWELKYAQYLHERWDKGEIEYWEPEPATFWFDDMSSSVRSYKPDFCVYENDRTESFHEIKGYMDERSKKCIELIGVEYPDIRLIIIDKDKFKKLFGTLRPYSERPRTEINLITLI